MHLLRGVEASKIQFTIYCQCKKGKEILNKLQTNAFIQFHNNNNRNKNCSNYEICTIKWNKIKQNKISCKFAVTAKHLTRSAAVQYNAKVCNDLSDDATHIHTHIYKYISISIDAFSSCCGFSISQVHISICMCCCVCVVTKEMTHKAKVHKE